MLNFAENILLQLREKSDQVLLEWPYNGDVRQFTGEEILSMLASAREWLRKKKIGPGSHCLLLQAPSPVLLFGMLALMAEGATVVLPPAGTDTQGVKDLQARYPELRVVLFPMSPWWLHLWLRLRGVPANRVPLKDAPRELRWLDEAAVEPPANTTALLSHSSGSTGRPKGIHRTHELLTAQHHCLKRVFPPFDGQRDLSIFPNVLLHQLACGVTSVLPDLPQWRLRELEGADILAQLVESGVNTLTGNPYFYKKLIEAAAGAVLLHVKAVGVGGAPVSDTLLRSLHQLFPNAQLYVIYGATEAEPISIRKYEGPTPVFRGYAVGTPVAKLQCRISDSHWLRLSGLLVVSGQIEVLGEHVLGQGNDWHPTGDFGYWHQDELYLTARLGNETVVAGTQHYVLENAARQLCKVDLVAAIACDDYFDVYYTGEDAPATLRAFFDAHFPLIPIRLIEKRAELPLDERHFSKILYHKLKDGNGV